MIYAMHISVRRSVRRSIDLNQETMSSYCSHSSYCIEMSIMLFYALCTVSYMTIIYGLHMHALGSLVCSTHIWNSGESRCDEVIFEFLIIKNENKSIDRSDSISTHSSDFIQHRQTKAVHASEIQHLSWLLYEKSNAPFLARPYSQFNHIDLILGPHHLSHTQQSLIDAISFH